ncbi:unnamed protein product [Medioppia subpectinata]|uniref:Mitochondrial inner membrane protease ATP23 n=1 Tax=Medioppia subpectinata TaxID=1979941 RepID=A0A7R9PV00_9ACAR|nr:unnamed protein product [Medioppia subpectinata]CAG2101341.1 unnamed protein product [Medioppia subpectinata]
MSKTPDNSKATTDGHKKKAHSSTAPTGGSGGGPATAAPAPASDPLDRQLTPEELEIYPERRGGRIHKNWVERMVDREDYNKIICEKRVNDVIESSPLVKLMMSAMKSHGCEVNIRRHISCECCSDAVTGGYDPQLNQVVVCQNRIWNKGIIRGILAHEFLHMFDYCRTKFDFNNLEHIACSEIRAANLFHCSMISSMLLGTTRPWNVAKTHANCVKSKAVGSIMAARKDLSPDEAWSIVDKVFDKCYNDLEPLGRRLRANSKDMEWVYRDRFHYNYDSI